MKRRELETIARQWSDEKEDRTLILITTERIDGDRMKTSTIIDGNKLNVLLTMFSFMKEQIDMMVEASEIGAVNELLGDIMGNIPPEKLDKNKDAFFKLIKDLEKLHTKRS